MQTYIIVCLVLAGAIIETFAQSEIVCQPNVCQTVKCGIPAECRHIPFPELHQDANHKIQVVTPVDQHRYRIIPRGGFCGCCALCQKLLGKSSYHLVILHHDINYKLTQFISIQLKTRNVP